MIYIFLAFIAGVFVGCALGMHIKDKEVPWGF